LDWFITVRAIRLLVDWMVQVKRRVEGRVRLAPEGLEVRDAAGSGEQKRKKWRLMGLRRASSWALAM
jgi:hypothetical protein